MTKNRNGPESGPDQVFVTDRWARYQWRRFVETEPKAHEVIRLGSEKVYSFPSLSREMFARLFADDVAPVKKIRPEDQWAVDVHRELAELPDFDRLGRRCRADRIAAGAAATHFLEIVVRKLPVAAPGLEDPDELREQVRGLLQFARNLATNGDDSSEVDGLIAEIKSRGQGAVRRAVEHARSIDLSELRRVLRCACDGAEKAVDQIDAQLAAFCGWSDGPGAERAIGVEVKSDLARRVRDSDKLQALAREAGRLRRIAAAKQRSKVDHAREEVVDVELGADLERVLPSELVKLTQPVLALEFTRQFCERCLLQYKLGGKEAQGRGPLVVCIDQSSSMEGPREIWSKALALALLQVATMQKRTTRVVHFNAGVARVDDWVPGKVNPLELLRSMDSFYGGGTALEPPLRSALESICREPKLKKADVVLVTDGEAELSDDFRAEWNAARKRFEFTCYAIHVDSAGGVAPPQLSAVADTIVGLADIASDLAATEVVLGI